jgi:GMP synthase (glutamine-hydrolysing)
MLLQSRFLSDPMLDHERRCFERATHLVEGELSVRNVFARIPDVDDVAAHDAFIGGSGDFSVVERDQPFFDPLARLLRQVVERGLPTFGCCFGFQLLVDAMGGRVVKDPARAEIGSFTVELTDEGAEDPLFGQLPRTFVAQMGHFDRASVLPDGVPNLVSSERCFFQALRFPGRPIWATQFHPELDDEGNKARCVAYIKEFGEIKGYEALPSPHALTILPRFLELVAAS